MLYVCSTCASSFRSYLNNLSISDKPEETKLRYYKAADSWSFGVILKGLITERNLLAAKSQHEYTINLLKVTDYEFEEERDAYPINFIDEQRSTIVRDGKAMYKKHAYKTGKPVQESIQPYMNVETGRWKSLKVVKFVRDPTSCI